MSWSGTKIPRTSLGSFALGIGKLRARMFGGVPTTCSCPDVTKAHSGTFGQVRI